VNQNPDAVPPGTGSADRRSPAAQSTSAHPRLQLKPSVPLADYVDGGWWPASRQLPVELPGLLADLSDRLDRVALVGYHRDAWDVAPDEVEINGAQVRLQGFSSNDPPTLVAIGNEGHCITLLVIPPDTTDTHDLSRDGTATCAHPTLNTTDGTQKAEVGDQYAARHNPFVYFHSITDSTACAANDVPLTRLSTDLAAASTTPNLTYITPNLCHDGHDTACVDGEPGGLVSADAFLKTWVPKIQASPAFGKDGLLVVTFNESDSPTSDSSAGDGEVAGPNSPAPGIDGPGGGRVGAVVLGRSVKAGTKTSTSYNHYALLGSIEDLFALPHLGFAATTPNRFGRDVYTASH